MTMPTMLVCNLGRRAASALVALLVVSLPAHRLLAQPDTAAAKAAADRAARDPSLRSGLRLPLPTLNLTASTTDKEVRGELGIATGDPRWIASFTLTAPIDQNAPGGRTTVADRDGLSHKASVSGGIFYYRWRPRADTARENRVCEAAKAEAVRTNALRRSQNSGEPQIDTAEFKFCRSTAQSEMPARFKRQLRNAVKWGFPLSLALDGGWGHDSFKWTDPTTLKSTKAEHENLQLRAAAASFYPPVGFLVVQYTRQRLFDGQPSTQLCVPRGGAGALTCSTTAIAPPTRSDDDLVTGEVRHFFGRTLAAGAVVTRDLTQKVTALEVPIYFVPDAAGKLNGGISGQWNSQDRSFRMAAFIGTVFKALYEKPK